MQRQFEIALDALKQEVLAMAGLVERTLDMVHRSLATRDRALAREVVALDDAIDDQEMVIDRRATEFIARHQPMATDLRFVIVAIKIGPELERVADNAANIARYFMDVFEDYSVDLPHNMLRMLALARAMVTDAIESYVARDAEGARGVIDRDDEVDAIYWETFHSLIGEMVEDPESVTARLNLILVARFAERIADQATNIAEEVVYLVEGRPIRHATRSVRSDGHREET
jgi:phosphate transport system protein